MSSLTIQEKLSAYINSHPELKKIPKNEIISIMLEKGAITQNEAIAFFSVNKDVKLQKDGFENFGLEIKKDTSISVLPLAELTREKAQDLSIDVIGQTISNAYESFKTQKLTQGDISRTYDMCKELLKSDLSVSKVDKAISLENLGYTYLTQARGGELTKKEYYEHIKEDLFLLTPNLNKLSDDAKINLKKRINSLSIEEVKLFEKKILELPKNDSQNYKKEAQNYLNSFANLTQKPQKVSMPSCELPSMQAKNTPEIRPKFIYSDGDELIKFEEVFQYERGTNFDSQKIAKYDNAKNMLCLASETSGKVKKIHSYLDNAINNPRDDWQATDVAKLEIGLKLSLETLFGDDEEVQKIGLEKMIGANENNDNVGIAKALLNKLDENLEKIMNGKTLEDYNEDYAKSYIDAFGRKSSEELTKAYIADNESISDKASGFIQVGGMGMMMVGGVMCLIPTGFTQAGGAAMLSFGGKVAMGGMFAQTSLKAINESSRTDGMTDEAKNEIIKEGLINAFSFAIGAGAGIKGAKVASNMLASGTSKWVAMAAERGIDATLSIAGDLMLTGNLNIEGNSIGQLTALMTGIKTGKNINKVLKTKNLNFSDDYHFKQPTETKVSSLNDNIAKEISSNNLLENEIVGGLSKNDFVKKIFNGKIELTRIGESHTRQIAENIHNDAALKEAEVLKIMAKLGLGEAGIDMTHRPKSSQSIYDKIKNDMLNDRSPVNIDDAIKGVRDAVGTRTELKDFDYKKYPEIVEMMKTDPQKAYIMAAEKQSEPHFDIIRNLIVSQAEGKSDISALNISNYKGKDGIPYFSDRQVAKLRDEAAKYGIDLNVKEKTTKIRPSGYTALQMNFKTKDGLTFEWQLRGSKVNKFAECEHVPYDIRENKDVTGGNTDLKGLYSPIEKIVKRMSDSDMNEYNGYLTKHYEYLRKSELGIDAEPPILPAKFDSRLSADNLDHLHSVADLIKKKEITPKEGLSYYNEVVKRDP